MTVAKKIGAKQLKKIAPYKNDWGQKNLNQTVYDKKKIRIKMTVAKKKSEQISCKKWQLIKMTVPKKIWTKQHR